jgi:hypothetical protein
MTVPEVKTEQKWMWICISSLAMASQRFSLDRMIANHATDTWDIIRHSCLVGVMVLAVFMCFKKEDAALDAFVRRKQAEAQEDLCDDELFHEDASVKATIRRRAAELRKEAERGNL